MVITGSTRQKGHMRLNPYLVILQQPSGLWLLQPAAASAPVKQAAKMQGRQRAGQVAAGRGQLHPASRHHSMPAGNENSGLQPSM